LKIPVQKRKAEAGSAVLVFILVTSFFLIGALGWGLDFSQMYAQRQTAQAAADAAAQAGIMSIFDGTNTGSTYGASGPYSTAATYTCLTADAGVTTPKTPCRYAALNGFTPASGDSVALKFGNSATTGAPAVSLSDSGTDPVSWMTVTVTRSVPTILMRLLGPTATTVTAIGTAAIVSVVSPVPIIVTHPTMASALDMNGTTSITITGGPQQSIQINSNGTNPSGNTLTPPSSGSINLSAAGPSGTGGDFGTFGAPFSEPSSINTGSTGHYISPHSPILDPLASVSPPSVPTMTPPQNGQPCSVLGHCSDCPAPGFSGTAPATCTEYLPGLYSSIDLTGVNSAIFDPGIYYIKGGGFTLKNDTVQMCSSCAADPTTANGMLIYDTCTAAPSCSAGSDSTGGFTVDTNVSAQLLGAGVSSINLTAAPASPYYGILFFEDRNADAHKGNGAHGSHTLGQGNGCFSVIGTIYITNTLGIMKGDPTHYQSVAYNGTPCSATQNYGEIIVSQLKVVGTSNLNMGLFPTGFLHVRQIALVQ
jgi:hypothetical protein